MAQLAEGIIGGLDVLVPLGGLEPPHLAPEASALSAELQGQTHTYYTLGDGQEQAKGIKTTRHITPMNRGGGLLLPKGLTSSTWLPMITPTCVQVARGGIFHVLPDHNGFR